MAANLSSYSIGNAIDLKTLTITKPDAPDQAVDITAIMEEMIIHEDLFQSSISAKLVLTDQINLVGTLPIVGGETVKISFKSPVRDAYTDLSFRVYKVGERDLPNDASTMQVSILYLCTEEVWWAANHDTGNAYQGTYDVIIGNFLKLTKTAKKYDSEASMGVATYISPMQDVFNSIKVCAAKAMNSTMSPYMFWESTKGYHFKSLKTMYATANFKRLRVQERDMALATDGETQFNTVFSIEYPESNNRLRQMTNMAFAGDTMTFDFRTKKLVRKSNDYATTFQTDGIHADGYPLNDDSSKDRDRVQLVIKQSDNSDMAKFVRNAAFQLMDNTKVYVSIPGDSDLEAGMTLWLDIPSRSALSVGKEEHTSGKWLVRSIKHLIQKKSFVQICELTKDSFAIKVRKDS